MDKLLIKRRNLKLDPWKNQESFGIVVVSVDAEHEANKIPTQVLDEGESIKVKSFIRSFLSRWIIFSQKWIG